MMHRADAFVLFTPNYLGGSGAYAMPNIVRLIEAPIPPGATGLFQNPCVLLMPW